MRLLIAAQFRPTPFYYDAELKPQYVNMGRQFLLTHAEKEALLQVHQGLATLREHAPRVVEPIESFIRVRFLMDRADLEVQLEEESWTSA